jgi:polar amino acid transport system substrate-binding protein
MLDLLKVAVCALKALTVSMQLSQSPSVAAEKIKVGLELMPPLIISGSEGHTVTLLRRIEEVTGLSFEIAVMPYNRAKAQLANGNIDLMGHTPYSVEERQFYNYALELDWHLPTQVDLYWTHPESHDENFSKLNRIGTQRGNGNFLAARYQLEPDRFFEADLPQLVKMLVRNRLDGIIFERASTMSTIRTLDADGIHYRQLDKRIAIGLAVRKSDDGALLKQRLDRAIQEVDVASVYQSYLRYRRLPQRGTVKLKENGAFLSP